MAVIDYGDVVFRIFDAMARGDRPEKVLMSQRQFNAYESGRRMSYRNSLPATKREMFIFDLPIVICPDCDLHVVSEVGRGGCFPEHPDSQPAEKSEFLPEGF